MSRKLHLALHPYGVGGPGQHGLWKDPRVANDASIDINYYIQQAQAAEHALFDALIIVDSQFINSTYPAHYLNRLEPLTLLSAVAATTKRIGLVGTVSSSYNAPFNTARRFASLDQISRGRAGWNVVATGDPGTASNYGRERHFNHEERYGRALEHVTVAQQLWDSYEDDAFEYDVPNDRFFDRDKQHAIDHHGEHFSVGGALNVSRSPQGQPVIFQAGDSAEGRDFGAAVGEGFFTLAATLEQALAYATDLRERAATIGRDPSTLLFFPGISPVIADDDEAARAIERSRYKPADFDKRLGEFGRAFGWHDFRQYDLDAPFPELPHLDDSNQWRGARAIVQQAKATGATLRETVELASGFRPSAFVGSPATVADEIERWFVAGALDGAILLLNLPSELSAFTERVLPLLRERGLFREQYESTTLRGHLGLPVPANRYTSVAV